MKVLVALAMASAASSLSIRAPSVQERANNCPKSVKSAWGVDFDVMCGVNQAGQSRLSSKFESSRVC